MATAAKKAPAKAASKPAEKPATKKPGTGLTVWQEELAAAAKKQAGEQRTVSQSSSINTAGGVLSYNGSPIEDNNLDCIILDAAITNVFYEGDYNPQVPASPICYASGYDEDELAPHKDSPDKQNATCQGCPQNEWESAPVGRGKACKNQMKLALVPADAADDAESMKSAEIITLNVPVTSVKGWVNHAREITSGLGLPTYGVKTNISVAPNPKGGFLLVFSIVDEGAVDFEVEGLYDALKRKIPVAESTTNAPYPVFEAVVAPPKSRKMTSKAAAGSGRTVAKPSLPASKTAAAKRKF